jgi:hypothetical protein
MAGGLVRPSSAKKCLISDLETDACALGSNFHFWTGTN